MSKRLLKSQCNDVVFKRDCLLCGNVCKMKDNNNPHRWVQVRQYKTVNRGSAITFKQSLENLCDEREDLWGNEVTARLSDLHTADARYHVPSYNRFRDSSLDHGNFGGGCGVRPFDYG